MCLYEYLFLYQVAWGSAQNLLAVDTVRDVYILNEQNMVASYRDQVSQRL